MKRTRSLIFGACLALVTLFAAAQSLAAGQALTCTESRAGSVYEVVCVALSDDSAGTVVGLTTNALDGMWINHITHVPGSGGVQPEDAYDITVKDRYGVDILGGGGGNLSQTTVTNQQPKVAATPAVVAEFAVRGLVTFAGTNIGNAKQFTVVFTGRK
jgi:hypothetical protein